MHDVISVINKSRQTWRQAVRDLWIGRLSFQASDQNTVKRGGESWIHFWWAFATGGWKTHRRAYSEYPITGIWNCVFTNRHLFTVHKYARVGLVGWLACGAITAALPISAREATTTTNDNENHPRAAQKMLSFTNEKNSCEFYLWHYPLTMTSSRSATSGLGQRKCAICLIGRLSFQASDHTCT